MAQNLIEKIAQKHAIGWPPKREVKSGDFITIRPAHIMTHDNTGAVIPKFKSIGATKMARPRQVVFTLDHNIQDRSEKNLKKYAAIEDFARQMSVDFYPAGRGIGHQIMCEEGYAWPGTMVVASDSHSNMYGGLGCLGTPVVRTDAAAIWATGRTWWQIPPVTQIILTGRLLPGVTGKDLIITLAGHFNKDQILNHALEFCGYGVAGLSIDQRLAVANMTTEWGALAGVFPVDEVTINWYKNRLASLEKRSSTAASSSYETHPRINQRRIEELDQQTPGADKDADYVQQISIDLSTIRPYISGPNSVKVMTSANELSTREITIHKAYLVSCVNSRLEDIREAAQIIGQNKVADGVDFYISAASSEVQSDSETAGYWQTLLAAGAKPLPPGCGPCIGLGTGLLEDGEVGISATNRNFKGRMGSANALAYLASPAVVAASAVAGKIATPFNLADCELISSIKSLGQAQRTAESNEIMPGFPESFEGEIVFCHQNNLNTDGIYPGKYTYQDELTAEQQAAVVMENYDPDFRSLVKVGDILVGGFNFGTGSSREQAATALKYKGIRMVIAGSLNETYKRNAINNGFLVVELPDIVRDLLTQFGTEKLTVKTGLRVQVNFSRSEIKLGGKIYSLPTPGLAAQEILVEGGLEEWVKNRL